MVKIITSYKGRKHRLKNIRKYAVPANWGEAELFRGLSQLEGFSRSEVWPCYVLQEHQRTREAVYVYRFSDHNQEEELQNFVRQGLEKVATSITLMGPYPSNTPVEYVGCY